MRVPEIELVVRGGVTLVTPAFQYTLVVQSVQRVLPLCIAALVTSCFQPAMQTPCEVSCATDGVCPTGLTCGADQLCHAGTIECSQQVNGTFGHQLITGDPTNGNPIETDLEYEADQLDVSAVLADTGAVPMVTFDGDVFGFSRNVVEEPYYLTVRAQQETMVPTETQDTSPTVALWTPYWGRISRSGINKITNINFTMTGTAPTRAYISSTGIRTFTIAPIVSPMTTLAFTFNYQNAGAIYGAAGALQANQGDVLYYTGYVQTVPDTLPVDNYYAITSAHHEMVTMMNGVTTAITAALTPTPQTRCVMLGAPRMTQLARLQASSPFGTAPTLVASSWAINAIPIASVNPGAGIGLVIMSAASTTGIVDQVVPAMYANPYPEDEVGIMTTQFRRTATLTGATSAATLTYDTIEYQQIPATANTGSCANVSLASNVALPSTPVLAGTTLDTDNQVVTFDRSNLLALTFPQVGDGNADDWQVNLEEVTNAGGITSLSTQLRIYSTLTTTVMIDPKLLVSGHSYIFQVVGRLGFPLAPMRDYRKISYPFATSQFYSSIFQVGS